MNKLKLVLLVIAVFTTLSKCHFPTNHSPIYESEIDSHLPSVKASFDFKGNGKDHNAIVASDVYTEMSISNINFPEINNDLVSGLKQQLKVLKYRKDEEIKSFGEVDINTEKLEKTIQELLRMKDISIPNISKTLSAYQLKGEDDKGNVFFTGYFTPVLKVSHEKTNRFKYPFYARPSGSSSDFPTRAQIDGEGVLSGKGLELAYAEKLADIYFMQVQGSGVVQYPDGSREIFAYAGSNGHPYSSIGKYMIEKGFTTPEKVSLTWIKRFLHQNPEVEKEILFTNSSYIFFERAKYQATPKGAGLVPLTTDYSIAVDSRYIPLGSCLLAAVPIINKQNKVVNHEYRVLIAQDKGGAIKGTGHVDLYCGVGIEGRNKASALHHYGKLWLLLPKEEINKSEKDLLAKL
jgi:peptidoglycan lytic transglycosylase A